MNWIVPCILVGLTVAGLAGLTFAKIWTVQWWDDGSAYQWRGPGWRSNREKKTFWAARRILGNSRGAMGELIWRVGIARKPINR